MFVIVLGRFWFFLAQGIITNLMMNKALAEKISGNLKEFLTMFLVISDGFLGLRYRKSYVCKGCNFTETQMICLKHHVDLNIQGEGPE